MSKELYARLFADPVAQGKLVIGPRSTIEPKELVRVKQDGFSLLSGLEGKDVNVTAFLADNYPIVMHGKPRHSVHLMVDHKAPRFIALNPMQNHLELTTGADPTTRLMATLTPLSDDVMMIDLHGSALSLHYHLLPLHSINALAVKNQKITLTPEGDPRLALFLVKEK